MFSIFHNYPELVVGLSSKLDGTMKLTEPMSQEVSENRSSYLHSLRIHSQQVVSAQIVHGNAIEAVSDEDKGKVRLNVDGLVTQTPKIFLSVTVADCLPIYIFDPVVKAIGMVHAGWRGLEQGIVQNVIRVLVEAYHSQSADMLVGIGPGIGKCHYAVGKEVIDAFEKLLPGAAHLYVHEADGQHYLDLKQAAKLQLLQAGVPDQQIEIHPACTYCETGKCFSYRRDNPTEVQAMLAVIGMR